MSLLKSLFNAKFIGVMIQFVMTLIPFIRTKNDSKQLGDLITPTVRDFTKALVEEHKNFALYFSGIADILNELVIEDDEVNIDVVKKALKNLHVSVEDREEVDYIVSIILRIYSNLRDRFTIIKNNPLSDSQYLSAFVKGLELGIKDASE